MIVLCEPARRRLLDGWRALESSLKVELYHCLYLRNKNADKAWTREADSRRLERAKRKVRCVVLFLPCAMAVTGSVIVRVLQDVGRCEQEIVLPLATAASLHCRTSLGQRTAGGHGFKVATT